MHGFITNFEMVDNDDFDVSDSQQNIDILRQVDEYMKNQTELFEMSHVSILELPPIMATFVRVTKLVLTNCDLLVLDNLPPKLEHLDLSNNKLERVSSEMIPQTVVELSVRRNNIRTLDLDGSPNIQFLDASDNQLDELVRFPPKSIGIHVNTTSVKTSSVFSHLELLRHLEIDMTDIKNIDDLPNNIYELSACKLYLNEINVLPKDIWTFRASSSDITRFNFSAFPNSLEHIDLNDNLLRTVPKFPDKMGEIDLARNDLIVVNFPKEFTKMDLRCNLRLKLTDEQIDFIETMRSNNVVVKIDQKHMVKENDFCDDTYRPNKRLTHTIIHTARYVL